MTRPQVEMERGDDWEQACELELSSVRVWLRMERGVVGSRT